VDFARLEHLRVNHPAWRLLKSDHAALVMGFLKRVFVDLNVRSHGQANLAEALEDELFGLRETLGPQAYPKAALEYLNDWAGNDKAWLRKFYLSSDEPQFELTAATEKAIGWLAALSERAFVGTESRLLMMFELLKQISEGSDSDPARRLADLHLRRAALDLEIARIERGDVPLLEATAIKDRYQQFAALARELLADFREVEHNFRLLDRQVRERIALWEGGKGALLDDILGRHDAIAESDQGRSFRAFFDFLMSAKRQEVLSERLERVLSLEAVADLKPDPRMKRVHYDWLEAGEHTQRTVAKLSQQLGRFIDDRARLENRRIMEILREIEIHAVTIRQSPPPREFHFIDELRASIELPFERPLHTGKVKLRLNSASLIASQTDIDTEALFRQLVIDRQALRSNVERALQMRPQIALTELLALNPLKHGVAELVVYLELAEDDRHALIDETVLDHICWHAILPDGQAVIREARCARVVFVQ